MDCLKGYIGLSAKLSVEVESGLYVEALPDISLLLSEGISEKGNDKVLEMWKDVEERALRKFRTLFIREINATFKISDIAVSDCLICKNKEVLATALWYFLGAELLTEGLGSSRINRFTTIDRQKHREMRAEMEEVFMVDLQTAIANLNLSKCTKTEKVCKKQTVEFVNVVIC